MFNAGSRYLTRIQSLSIPNGSGMHLDAYLLPFEINDFQFDDFAREQIACPATILRSVRKRQAEYFFGRLVARAALQGAGIERWEVDIGDSGEPIWPSSVAGSITHSDSFAAALVTTRARYPFVGVDIENVVSDEEDFALRNIVFDQHEIALLQRASRPFELRHLMTIAFSAKESLFKALFPRTHVRFGFDAVSLVEFDAPSHRLRFALAADLALRLPERSTFDLTFQWLAPTVVFTSLVA